MTLDKKIALLRANGQHEGSAWLIDATHALTALHCVQDDDGSSLGALTLEFPGSATRIDAEVIEIRSEFDVALLRITNPTADLVSFVLPLSRRSFESREQVLMHGHPALGAKANPNGSTVRATIHHPRSPYAGQAGRLECEAIVCSNMNISVVPNGAGSTIQLQGLSGGAVVSDEEGEGEAVVGLVLEEGMNGSHIYGIAITDVARYFAQVEIALQGSRHVNRIDRRVLIEAADSSNVRWSAAIDPAEVGELWLPVAGPDSASSLHCANMLWELGAAGQALIRLAAYAGMTGIYVPDAAAWNGSLTKLDALGRKPDVAVQILNSVPAIHPAPALWRTYSSEALACEIHNSLNLRLLSLLSKNLYACLIGIEDSDLGGAIEAKLRSKMWMSWQAWFALLSNDAELREHFLTRIFRLDVSTNDFDETLISVGCCRTGQQQLKLATLMALVLHASGVEVKPHPHASGNLIVDSGSGHACGINKRDRAALHTFAETVDWKAEVVFLPYLSTALIELYGGSVSLTKRQGTAGYGLVRLPPVAVTTDRLFLQSVAQGGDAVRAYYELRVEERLQHQEAMTLPTRTEALDA
ncbi:ABC-three component system protein [Paraburkholderia sediminicola]|uniref:ABC-three component system protein n=1 Tax=Paraburkholderia sediminicola TaxID=458836 RepID=UPI0038B82150